MARGQQQVLPWVGFLYRQSLEGFAWYVAAFRDGLRDAGFVDGKNVLIEYRFAEGHYERLPALMAELLERRPTVIAATGGVPAAAAAKAATKTIPVVFEVGTDPLESGLVTSLNRPGGNLTGVTHTLNTLGPKLLELIREVVPADAPVALLVNPQFPSNARYADALQRAAHVVGQRLQIVRASNEAEISAAFDTVQELGAGALIIQSEPFFLSQRKQIVDLAARRAIPTVYPGRLFAEAGGLISYATDVADVFRETGRYTGRILKGDRPATCRYCRRSRSNSFSTRRRRRRSGLHFHGHCSPAPTR